jgi:hypothetical protein
VGLNGSPGGSNWYKNFPLSITAATLNGNLLTEFDFQYISAPTDPTSTTLNLSSNLNLNKFKNLNLAGTGLKILNAFGCGFTDHNNFFCDVNGNPQSNIYFPSSLTNLSISGGATTNKLTTTWGRAIFNPSVTNSIVSIDMRSMGLNASSVNYILQHLSTLRSTGRVPNLLTVNLGNDTGVNATNCGPDSSSNFINGLTALLNLQSAGVTVTTVCSCPTASNINFSNVTTTSFTVTWTIVGTQTYTVTRYLVDINGNITGTPTILTLQAGPLINVTGLASLTTYEIQILCTGGLDSCKGIKRVTTL